MTLRQVWFRVSQGVFTGSFTAKGFLMSWGRYDFAPYVPVAQKLGKAVKLAAQVAKKQKREPAPVKLQGRTIAKTFWGKAWCDNLTAYQDFSNRLPRGATYVRNGSVVDLVIHPKKIAAIVAGSEPYTVKIEITELDAKRWKSIRSECSESIDSLLDLLSGKLSDGVMKRLTDQTSGLFPAPREIRMSCSCPDYSSCCKHLAAVMYGVGARLDSQPELLFLLRGVDHQELVSQAIAAGNLDRELSAVDDNGLGTLDLSELFGIELDSSKPVAIVSGKVKAGKVKAGQLKAGTKNASSGKVADLAAKIMQPSRQKKAAKKVPSGKKVVKLELPTGSKKAELQTPGKNASGPKKLVVKESASNKKSPTKSPTKKKVATGTKAVAKSAARPVKRPKGTG